MAFAPPKVAKLLDLRFMSISYASAVVIVHI